MAPEKDTDGPAPQTQRLRILNFNKGCNEPIGRVKSMLKELAHDFDVITMQEVIQTNDKHEADELADAIGFDHYFEPAHFFDRWFNTKGARRGIGNAILSKRPLEQKKKTDVRSSVRWWDPTDERRVYMETRIADSPWTIATTHLSNLPFLHGTHREILPIVKEAQEKKAYVLGGDFNLSPFRFLRKLPSLWIAKIEEILQNAGPHYEHISSHGFGFIPWKDRRDYLYTSKDVRTVMTDFLKEYGIGGHYPLSAELELLPS